MRSLNTSTNFLVRSSYDPYLVARYTTLNTFNFGYASKDLFIVGLVFGIVGLLMCIQPTVFLVKTKMKLKRYGSYVQETTETKI